MPDLDRRKFLRASLAAVAALALPRPREAYTITFTVGGGRELAAFRAAIAAAYLYDDAASQWRPGAPCSVARHAGKGAGRA